MTWWRIKTVECGMLREEVSPGEGHAENYHIGTYTERVMQVCAKRFSRYVNLETHELPDHFDKEEILEFFVNGKISKSISRIAPRQRRGVRVWMRRKMIDRYKRAWGRAPYKEEVKASLNFVLNPIFKERNSKK